MLASSTRTVRASFQASLMRPFSNACSASNSLRKISSVSSLANAASLFPLSGATRCFSPDAAVVSGRLASASGSSFSSLSISRAGGGEFFSRCRLWEERAEELARSAELNKILEEKPLQYVPGTPLTPEPLMTWLEQAYGLTNRVPRSSLKFDPSTGEETNPDSEGEVELQHTLVIPNFKPEAHMFVSIAALKKLLKSMCELVNDMGKKAAEEEGLTENPGESVSRKLFSLSGDLLELQELAVRIFAHLGLGSIGVRTEKFSCLLKLDRKSKKVEITASEARSKNDFEDAMAGEEKTGSVLINAYEIWNERYFQATLNIHSPRLVGFQQSHQRPVPSQMEVLELCALAGFDRYAALQSWVFHGDMRRSNEISDAKHLFNFLEKFRFELTSDEFSAEDLVDPEKSDLILRVWDVSVEDKEEDEDAEIDLFEFLERFYETYAENSDGKRSGIAGELAGAADTIRYGSGSWGWTEKPRDAEKLREKDAISEWAVRRVLSGGDPPTLLAAQKKLQAAIPRTEAAAAIVRVLLQNQHFNKTTEGLLALEWEKEETEALEKLQGAVKSVREFESLEEASHGLRMIAGAEFCTSSYGLTYTHEHAEGNSDHYCMCDKIGTSCEHLLLPGEDLLAKRAETLTAIRGILVRQAVLAVVLQLARAQRHGPWK